MYYELVMYLVCDCKLEINNWKGRKGEFEYFFKFVLMFFDENIVEVVLFEFI